MKEKTIDLIGIANPGQDLVVELENLPRDVVSSRMYDCSFQGGGWVATALCAAGNLGAKTSFLGVIGDDVFGNLIKTDFEFNHVDTSHLIVDEGKRSNFCMCITERSTKNKFLISRPGECREVQLSDLDKEFIQSASMMHVGAVNEAIRKAADMIHEAGGLVSVDAAYYQPYIYDHYDIYDILIGSEYFFDGLCAELGKKFSKEMSDDEKFEVMRYLQTKGPKIVIFTFGPDGSKGVYEDKTFSIPAMDVPVVDTTGAGDVFHGAFDVAYLKGMDVVEAAKFATGVSSIKCTQLGGRAGIPDLETLKKYLETGVIDYDKINDRVAKYKHGLKG